MAVKLVKIEQESKDVFRAVVSDGDREYSDRFSLGGLEIALENEEDTDSLSYKIRAAMLKAAKNKVKKTKKETLDVSKTDQKD